MAADPTPLRPGHGPLRWMGHLRPVETAQDEYEPPAPVWTGPAVMVTDSEWESWERGKRRAIAESRTEADRERLAERRRANAKRAQEELVAALQYRVHEQDQHIEHLAGTVENLTVRVRNLAELTKQLLALHLGEQP